MENKIKKMICITTMFGLLFLVTIHISKHPDLIIQFPFLPDMLIYLFALVSAVSITGLVFIVRQDDEEQDDEVNEHRKK